MYTGNIEIINYSFQEPPHLRLGTKYKDLNTLWRFENNTVTFNVYDYNLQEDGKYSLFIWDYNEYKSLWIMDLSGNYTGTVDYEDFQPAKEISLRLDNSGDYRSTQVEDEIYGYYKGTVFEFPICDDEDRDKGCGAQAGLVKTVSVPQNTFDKFFIDFSTFDVKEDVCSENGNNWGDCSDYCVPWVKEVYHSRGFSKWTNSLPDVVDLTSNITGFTIERTGLRNYNLGGSLDNLNLTAYYVSMSLPNKDLCAGYEGNEAYYCQVFYSKNRYRYRIFIILPEQVISKIELEKWWPEGLFKYVKAIEDQYAQLNDKDEEGVLLEWLEIGSWNYTSSDVSTFTKCLFGYFDNYDEDCADLNGYYERNVVKIYYDPQRVEQYCSNSTSSRGSGFVESKDDNNELMGLLDLKIWIGEMLRELPQGL